MLQILTQMIPIKMRTIPSHWLRSSRSRRKIHESSTVTAPYSEARTLTTETGPNVQAGVVGYECGGVHQPHGCEHPPNSTMRKANALAGWQRKYGERNKGSKRHHPKPKGDADERPHGATETTKH